MAAVLEYITAEFLEAAGNVCLESKKQVITPKHINLGMRVDDCLDKLMVFATISQGGNLVQINDFLLPGKNKGKQGNQ